MGLKNKHMMTAMLVAPLLALISYFAIEAFVGETPHAAEEGKSYQLAEKPNCRYNSGSCGLKNGDFELMLTPETIDEDRLLLTLSSEFPLEGVVLGLVTDGAEDSPPIDMRPMDDKGLVWSLDFALPDAEHSRLRLVASANHSLWFGDAALKFILPTTVF